MGLPSRSTVSSSFAVRISVQVELLHELAGAVAEEVDVLLEQVAILVELCDPRIGAGRPA